MSIEGFAPIPGEKIPLLLEVLSKRLPSSANLWNMVKLLNDRRYSSHLTTTFFSYNDTIDDESLLFAIQQKEFSIETGEAVTVSGPKNLMNVTERMTKAFEEAFNWAVDIYFCAVDEDLVNHMKIPEMCSRNGSLVHIDPCYMYYYEIEKALKLDLNKYSGVIVSPLAPSEAKIVTDSWKFSGPGTLERMEDCIKTIGSAGLYVQSENKGKILASWVAVSHIGTINALHTHVDYRRRGYAKIVMEAVSRYAADDGLIPNVQIQLENEASKALMEQLDIFNMELQYG
ncbi:unnamed protein product [Allacma fusca]|uniref:N-acetyltransferase domain-containing protein n=1 Tax=Allacma fusca TaxID=39272 RepID=A0A8J2JA50_9HEXA|nr:unnamed protein product [Allacma fusca]